MVQKNYGLIVSVAQFEQFVDRFIDSNSVVAFDAETGYDGNPFEGGSLSPLYKSSKVVGFSFTNSTEWARYVPLAHDLGTNLDNEAVAHLLWKLLTSVPIISHNGGFELRFLRKYFKTYIPDVVADRDGWFPIFSDTMIEAYVEGTEPKFGLKALTKSVFNHDQVDLIDLFPGLAKNKSKTLRFNLLDLTPEVVSYACEDAVWCLALHQKFYPLVKDRLIYKTEMEIIDVLAHMEKEETGGVLCDWAAMAQANVQLEDFIVKYNAQIMDKLSVMLGAPVDINLGSPAQLRAVLFDELGMKSSKITDSGLDSTGAIALEALSKRYPVVREILDYKEMKRLQSTFLVKYPRDYTFATDGYMHSSLLQAFVPSGRFACSSPNLQQLPNAPYYYELESASRVTKKHLEVHDKDDDRRGHCKISGCVEFEHLYPEGSRYELNFRDMIISKPDHFWLGYDYSQIELRMLAGIANEPYLKEAFDIGKDIHSVTASLMLGIPLAEVTKGQRQIGKTLGFAVLYGLGTPALAARLAIRTEEAQELVDKYYSAFSNVAAWADKVIAEGKKNGYVTSKFGRINKIWEFSSSERWIYSKGDRLCVNAVVQGAAADFMKIAMVRQHKALKKAGLFDKVHLIMNIHDALEYQVHESIDPTEVIEVLTPAVCFPLSGFPEMVADWHIGYKYGSLYKIKFDDAKKPVIPDFRTEVVNVSVAKKEIHAPDSAESFAMTTEAGLALQEMKEVPKLIVIELKAMPDVDNYKKFMVKFKAISGDNKVVLKTPQGELILQGTTGINLKDAKEIDLFFPGCVVSSLDGV